MEHYPFITLNDQTEITYSDIKKDINDTQYISIYFETPNKTGGFSDMRIDYPFDNIVYINGYSEEEKNSLLVHYNKVSALAFELAMEEENELCHS